MNSYESFASNYSALPGQPFSEQTMGRAPPPGACVLEPILEERVERVYRECIEDHIVEVPDVRYVEKVIEVPQEKIEEKIVQVVKPVRKELIRYVPKDTFVDQVVEYEEVKASRKRLAFQRSLKKGSAEGNEEADKNKVRFEIALFMQYVDKVVEVPCYNMREKIVEVPKVMVIERIIPVLKTYNHTSTRFAVPSGSTPPRRQLSTKPAPLCAPSAQQPLREAALPRRSEELPREQQQHQQQQQGHSNLHEFRVPSLHTSNTPPAPVRSASGKVPASLNRAATLPAELSPHPSISREGFARASNNAGSTEGTRAVRSFERDEPRIMNAMSSIQ